MVIRNTAANLAGQLLYPLLAVALVPFYIRRLGLEGYGFIGLMALVLTLLLVFSRGLGSALQREVSGRLGSPSDHTLRTLLRSMEVVYWSGALVLAAGCAILALTAGRDWLAPATIAPSAVTACLLLLAVRVALAVPHGVYLAMLFGAERQVLASGLTAAMALTAAATGVLGVLVWDSVVAVYAAEAITAGIYLAVFRHHAYRILPEGPARFDRREVAAIGHLSAALLWTSGVGLLISNLDRVFVTLLLPVTALAVYTIAVMGGRVVTLVINPYLQAAYPGLCRTARHDGADAQALHILRNASVVTVIVAGVGVPLCGFAAEALTLWVRDEAVAADGAPLMALYVAGSLLIATASVLYQWQTAADRTRAAVLFNLSALAWFPILLWIAMSQRGLTGAAAAWTVYGALAWVVNIAATFGPHALPRRWVLTYLRLTILAVLPAVLATAAARAAADLWAADVLLTRVGLAAAGGVVGAALAVLIVAPVLDGGGLPRRFVKIAAERFARRMYIDT